MTKADFDNTVSSLNSKMDENKTKNGSVGKSHFEKDGMQTI